jgi:hypothetical protein
VAFRAFVFPEPRKASWPLPFGVIDASVFDLPHAASALEQWTFECHFGAAQVSAFVSFSVANTRGLATTGGSSFYQLNWAISDIATATCVRTRVVTVCVCVFVCVL